MANLQRSFILSLPLLHVVFLPPLLVTCQNFDAVVDDKTYLERIENLLMEKVELAKEDLIREGNLVNGIAEQFIRTKVKQNLFKKLRPLVEKELETFVNFQRQARQNNNNEEEEEADEEETTTVSGNGTRAATIIPQVANLVKAIFGGNSINITSYVQGATKFLPPSIGNQVLGVVKLLAHTPNDRWTTTTTSTEPPTQATSPSSSLILVKRLNNTLAGTKIRKPIQVNSNSTNSTAAQVVASPTPFLVKPNTKSKNTTKITSKDEGTSTNASKATISTTTLKSKITTEEDEDEDEEENFRQLRIPGLSEGINALGSLFGGGGGARRPTVNATTESASGFEEEATAGTGGVDLRDFASGVRSGLGDLLKAMPDLFKGAREAVGLLSGIQSLLGSFGG